MRLPTPQTRRPGLTLLEVLVATTILVLALGGINSLVSMASDHALEVQIRNQASRLCQSTLARVMSGELPLSGQGDTPVDEDPDYQWSVDCDQSSVGSAGTVNNLWTVNVKVTHDMPGSEPIVCTLTQMLIDPSVIGSTQDVTPIAGSTASNPNASSGTTASTTTNTGGAAGAMGGAAPAKNSGSGTNAKPAANPAPAAAAPKMNTPAAPSGAKPGGK